MPTGSSRRSCPAGLDGPWPQRGAHDGDPVGAPGTLQRRFRKPGFLEVFSGCARLTGAVHEAGLR
eukprot:4427757-Pyramimonas_sp.AAC.1